MIARVRSADEPPVGPVGVAMIVASLLFLAAAIAWPQAADALLRMLLATLAVGFVAARAYEAMFHVGMTQDSYSPFDGDVGSRISPAAPQVLRNLTLELSAADEARRSERTAIPWRVRQTLVEEAARRLAGNHGLNLHDPDQHGQIRTLVSRPTWLLLGAGDPEPGGDGQAIPSGRPVPLSQLGPILDDLERL